MNQCYVIKSNRKVYSIPFEHIYFFESDIRKVTIHTQKGKLTYYGKLGDAVNKLDERFMRCHKSFIINMDEILSINNGKIVLNDTQEERAIYLGRDTGRKAMKSYEEYMKKTHKS